MAEQHTNTYTFTPIPLETAFPNSLALEDVQSYLSKWDVLKHLKIGKFRFDAPIDVKDTTQVQDFIGSLLASSPFAKNACSIFPHKSYTPYQITGVDPSQPVSFTLIPATITSMAILDRLVDHKVVSKDYDCEKAESLITKAKIHPSSSRYGELSPSSLDVCLSTLKMASSALTRATGRISQCYEDLVDNMVLSDTLKQTLFNPDHELYELYSSQERTELFMRILSMCVGGGELGQSEDAIGAYGEVAKRIYKDLVSVHLDPHSGYLCVQSSVISVHEATVLVAPVDIKNITNNMGNTSTESSTDGTSAAIQEASGEVISNRAQYEPTSLFTTRNKRNLCVLSICPKKRTVSYLYFSPK